MRTAAIASTLLGLTVANECQSSFNGQFEITVAQVTLQKRDLTPRASCGSNGALVMSLNGGVAKDGLGRTGYIASNGQFQFDSPPQANALVTSGFSLCQDNLLSLAGNKTFFRCLSGTFYNLYNVNWAPQCEGVSILAIPCGSAAAASQGGDGQVSQGGDGQVVGTTLVHTTLVTALSDGQPQVITTQVPVPVTSYFPTSAAVTQISDGQIQVPPPQTATSVATASVPVKTTSAAAPSSPASSASASVSASAPVGSVAPSTSAPAGSASAPSSVASSSAVSISKVTSAASSAASSAPAATTSAPSQNRSSRMTASAGALIVAFIGFALL